jgi:hypothetical protein
VTAVTVASFEAVAVAVAVAVTITITNSESQFLVGELDVVRAS